MRFHPIKRLPVAEEDGLLGAAEKYALRLRGAYDSRAHWHRRFYRASGNFVILSGASLPVVTALNYSGKAVTVSVLGVLVAALTALRAFYRWDQSWILLRLTEMAITAEYWDWKSATSALDQHSSEPKDVESARQFLKKLSEIRSKEAESFFAELSFPGGQQRQIQTF